MCMMMMDRDEVSNDNSIDHNTLGQHQLNAQTRSSTRRQAKKSEADKAETIESDGRHTQAKSTQMTVEGSLLGVRVVCLIDTRASISFAAEELVEQTKNTVYLA
eukprot:SAG11_NODE_16650_length_541_cov_1.237557_2_plen_104_part_00